MPIAGESGILPGRQRESTEPLRGSEPNRASIDAYSQPIVMAYLTFTNDKSSSSAFGCLILPFEGLTNFLTADTSY
jgi:hypothetical protein